MTDKQLIKFLHEMQRVNRRDLKLLADLKLKLDIALDAQQRGHTNKWAAVGKQLDKVNDFIDCEYMVDNL